jgi:hypothetical protein
MSFMLHTQPGSEVGWNCTCPIHIHAVAEPSAAAGVIWNGSELVCDGPGGVSVFADAPVSSAVGLEGVTLDAYFQMQPARSMEFLSVRARFPWFEPARKWVWRGDTPAQ